MLIYIKNQGRYLELGKKEYDKERKKEYREKNAVKIKENRDANKNKLYEKFTCSCGGKYTHCCRSRHFKTKKHLKYLQEQAEE